MFSKLLVAICAVLLALTNAKFGNKLVTRKLASKSDLQQGNIIILLVSF